MTPVWQSVEESLRRHRRQGVIHEGPKEKSLRSNHWGGVIEQESRSSNYAGLLQEVSWKGRHESTLRQPGDILDAPWNYLAGILEASGETWESLGVQEACERHLGIIWE